MRGEAESGRVTAAAGSDPRRLPSAWFKSPAGICRALRRGLGSVVWTPLMIALLSELFLVSLAPPQAQAGHCLVGQCGEWGSPLVTALHSQIITFRKRSTIFPDLNVQRAI